MGKEDIRTFKIQAREEPLSKVLYPEMEGCLDRIGNQPRPHLFVSQLDSS